MWLLKLHFAISILCFFSFWGIKIVFEDRIKENGYIGKVKTRGKIKNYIILFSPVLNIMTIIALWLMVTVKKSDLEEWVEEHKKEVDK